MRLLSFGVIDYLRADLPHPMIRRIMRGRVMRSAPPLPPKLPEARSRCRWMCRRWRRLESFRSKFLWFRSRRRYRSARRGLRRSQSRCTIVLLVALRSSRRYDLRRRAAARALSGCERVLAHRPVCNPQCLGRLLLAISLPDQPDHISLPSRQFRHDTHPLTWAPARFPARPAACAAPPCRPLPP